MKVNDFFGKMKEKYFKIESKIVEWIRNNKKTAIIMICLLSIMLICIILLVGVSSRKKTPKDDSDLKLELNHELVIPNGPELPKGYNTSRETTDAWSEEEAERWFSTPSETDIDGLSKANDMIIDGILGGTP